MHIQKVPEAKDSIFDWLLHRFESITQRHNKNSNSNGQEVFKNVVSLDNWCLVKSRLFTYNCIA